MATVRALHHEVYQWELVPTGFSYRVWLLRCRWCGGVLVYRERPWLSDLPVESVDGLDILHTPCPSQNKVA